MVINVIGGLIVGVAQHHMPLGDAASTYTLLTIGDGLVAGSGTDYLNHSRCDCDPRGNR